MPAHDRKKPLALVALNEINLDLIAAYPRAAELYPHLCRLAERSVRTSSEASHEELEPWIQWSSVHTGLTYREHGIFRLGDVVSSGVPQIYEKIEARGYRIGMMAVMNAANRLRDPAYFIPDPWTATVPDASPLSRRLAAAVSQVVNDNSARKVDIASAITLSTSLLRFADPRKYGLYLGLMTKARAERWKLALLLDLLLSDLNRRLMKTRSPDFAFIFLNAGAHIQHHYMFNARPLLPSPIRNPEWYIAEDKDPVADVAHVYERIVGDYLSDPRIHTLFVTGLSQIPHERECFYWRLKDHRTFLQMLGLKFRHVLPRMTRDFLIEFDSERDSYEAERYFRSLVAAHDGTVIFDEIDNRGSSLFLTLGYPRDIHKGFTIRTTLEKPPTGLATSFDLSNHVVFVALKNGRHHPEGYFYASDNGIAFQDLSHVKEVFRHIDEYFA